MTEAQLKETIVKMLGQIAPEADLSTLGPDENVRETLDIDSFDHLNFLIGLQALGSTSQKATTGSSRRWRPSSVISLPACVEVAAARNEEHHRDTEERP